MHWFATTIIGIFFTIIKDVEACSIFFIFLYTKEVVLLNKIICIFLILEILGKKENKIPILRKSKILSLQILNQVFFLIFFRQKQ